jgi:Leucine-rich repeat (LRR) protein
MSASAAARARLEKAYGFRFPESFFAFARWHRALLAKKLDLRDVLDLSLAAPFQLLEADVDGAFDPVSEGRYYNDPPEFFTILTGHIDGLHYGYWLDAGEADEYPVVGYYHSDAFELHVEGSSIFDALGSLVRRATADAKEAMAIEDDSEREYNERRLEALGKLERALADAPLAKGRKRTAIAETRERMGIVVPPARYRPLKQKKDPFQIWNYVPSEKDAARMEREAMKLLEDGFPGAALKLGRDLWIYKDQLPRSVRLLDAAYATLRRPIQRGMLRFRRPRGGEDEPEIARALAAPKETTSLSVGGNNLESLPARLGELRNLESLLAFNNRLSSLPPELARLEKLERVQLDTNAFTEIPAVLYDLAALKWLYLRDNPIAEVDPDKIMRAVEELFLSGGQIVRFPRLERWPKLAKLHLRDTSIVDLGVDVGPFPALEELELHTKKTPRDVSWRLGESPKLRALRIDCTVAAGHGEHFPVPSGLLSLPRLEALELRTNQIPVFPTTWPGLAGLKSLRFEAARLPEIPAAVAGLEKLTHLGFTYAPITELPRWLTKLAALEELDLYATRVESFPDWIAELPRLRRIRQASGRISKSERARLAKLVPNVTIDA